MLCVHLSFKIRENHERLLNPKVIVDLEVEHQANRQPIDEWAVPATVSVAYRRPKTEISELHNKHCNAGCEHGCCRNHRNNSFEAGPWLACINLLFAARIRIATRRKGASDPLMTAVQWSAMTDFTPMKSGPTPTAVETRIRAQNQRA